MACHGQVAQSGEHRECYPCAMPTCLLCDNDFPTKLLIDGKVRNLQRRKYCLICSPFGSGNRRKLITGGDTAVEGVKAASKYIKWQRKARRERKLKLIALMGGGCLVCGYSKCIAALDFHHRDPAEKSFSLASQGILRKWDGVLEEAKKCDILCRNCHAETHYNGSVAQ